MVLGIRSLSIKMLANCNSDLLCYWYGYDLLSSIDPLKYWPLRTVMSAYDFVIKITDMYVFSGSVFDKIFVATLVSILFSKFS